MSDELSPTLEELGWTDELAAALDPASGLVPGRVVSVYAAMVDLLTADGWRRASLRGKTFRDTSIAGGIAVGDWAAARPITAGDGKEVVVESILPRRTVFMRQAAGERSEPQAICANVDRVFIVTSAGDGAESDFNIRRIERYLVAIAAGGAAAEIVLTKADLASDLAPLIEVASALAPVIVTSARDGTGIDELRARIGRGQTATLVGSSGVGKSALVNRLLGRDEQLEGAVRSYDGRGRHTTTRRALFVLPGGGLLIDTPGMRELKPWLGDREGAELEDGFEDVAAVAASCRYRDCKHAGEPGCAVAAAVEDGTVDRERVEGWQKLAREQAVLAPRQIENAKRQARSLDVALRKRLREKGR